LNDPIAILFADAHLQDTAWKGSGITGDAYCAFDQIIDLAAERSLDIVCAGDLLDEQRNRSRPVAYLQEAITRINAGGSWFYYVRGNHDYDDPPWLHGTPGAEHVNGGAFALGPYRCYGLDYHSAETLPAALEAVPKWADLLITHQAWAEWMGSVTLPQGSFAQVPHAQLVFTGDLHEFRDETFRGRDGQPLRAISPGATCTQAWGEPGEHYVVLMDASGHFERHALKSRLVYHGPRLLSPEDLDRFLVDLRQLVPDQLERAATLPEAIRTPVFRVTYLAELDDAERRVRRAVGEAVHLRFKVVPPVRATAGGDGPVTVAGSDLEGAAAEAMTLVAALPQFVDPAAEPLAYGLLARCLEAPDAAAAFAAWQAEFLAAEPNPEPNPEPVTTFDD
jgi:predicted phosphodiesterase